MKTVAQLRESLHKYRRGVDLNEMSTSHTAGNHGEDKTYGHDYDSPSTAHHQAAGRIMNNVAAHAKAKGYKVNHDGHPDHVNTKQHTKPDITFHTARGDDTPHAYTVHHGGAGANDQQLHHKKYQY